MVILFILLAVCLIMGSALILLRTAHMPKSPEHLKGQSHQQVDDQDD